jgi:hypothetical protein
MANPAEGVPIIEKPASPTSAMLKPTGIPKENSSKRTTTPMIPIIAGFI